VGDLYTSTGKQVLCNGGHFCDAATPEAAITIVEPLA